MGEYGVLQDTDRDNKPSLELTCSHSMLLSLPKHGRRFQTACSVSTARHLLSTRDICGASQNYVSEGCHLTDGELKTVEALLYGHWSRLYSSTEQLHMWS